MSPAAAAEAAVLIDRCRRPAAAAGLKNMIMWWLPGVMSDTHLLIATVAVFGVWK